MSNIDSLNAYMIYVTQGYQAAGYTFGDLAANGGDDKLRSKLHVLAAISLMESGNGLSLEEAREIVSLKLQEYINVNAAALDSDVTET